MWLINTRTLQLENFSTTLVPPYAILSDTWGGEEVTFQDMQSALIAESKRGFEKIRYTCTQAREEYLSYAWVDTCCIDKSSSVELQEGINSMYRWYAEAEVCYVYLQDVLGSCPRLEERNGPFLQYCQILEPEASAPLEDEDADFWRSALSNALWFTRGWTLQELIAPRTLKLYGSRWNQIGTKLGLCRTLSQITGIDVAILEQPEHLSSVSVAKRMSWAAKRQTSRNEDRAYSLLGIFDVNMAMLYGEGMNAFRRLQEEIIRSTSDHSIFAWSARKCDKGSLLAQSPADFANSANIVCWGKPKPFELTNRGLRIATYTMPYRDDVSLESGQDEHARDSIFFRSEKLASLNCSYEDNFDGTLALRLTPYLESIEYHVAIDGNSEEPNSTAISGRLFFVSLDCIGRAQQESVEVTKQREHRNNTPKYLLKVFADNAAEDNVFQIVEQNPRRYWNVESGIMRIPVNPKGHVEKRVLSRLRGRVLFRLMSGTEVSLVFGCASMDRRTGSVEPGVLAWLHKDPIDWEIRSEVRPLSIEPVSVRDPLGPYSMVAVCEPKHILGVSVYVVTVVFRKGDLNVADGRQSAKLG